MTDFAKVAGSGTRKYDKKAKSSDNGIGVLRNLRILKPMELKTSRSDPAPNTAYFLGTVMSYRKTTLVQKGTGRGRPVKICVGHYHIKFDYGGSESMLPDEVIECANLFYRQREIELGHQDRPSHHIDVLSSINLEDSHHGIKLLLQHQNPPLHPDDMLILMEERKEYFNCADNDFSRTGTKPPSPVTPLWFTNHGKVSSRDSVTEMQPRKLPSVALATSQDAFDPQERVHVENKNSMIVNQPGSFLKPILNPPKSHQSKMVNLKPNIQASKRKVSEISNGEEVISKSLNNFESSRADTSLPSKMHSSSNQELTKCLLPKLPLSLRAKGSGASKKSNSGQDSDSTKASITKPRTYQLGVRDKGSETATQEQTATNEDTMANRMIADSAANEKDTDDSDKVATQVASTMADSTNQQINNVENLVVNPTNAKNKGPSDASMDSKHRIDMPPVTGNVFFDNRLYKLIQSNDSTQRQFGGRVALGQAKNSIAQAARPLYNQRMHQPPSLKNCRQPPAAEILLPTKMKAVHRRQPSIESFESLNSYQSAQRLILQNQRFHDSNHMMPNTASTEIPLPTTIKTVNMRRPSVESLGSFSSMHSAQRSISSHYRNHDSNRSSPNTTGNGSEGLNHYIDHYKELLDSPPRSRQLPAGHVSYRLLAGGESHAEQCEMHQSDEAPLSLESCQRRTGDDAVTQHNWDRLDSMPKDKIDFMKPESAQNRTKPPHEGVDLQDQEGCIGSYESEGCGSPNKRAKLPDSASFASDASSFLPIRVSGDTQGNSTQTWEGLVKPNDQGFRNNGSERSGDVISQSGRPVFTEPMAQWLSILGNVSGSHLSSQDARSITGNLKNDQITSSSVMRSSQANAYDSLGGDLGLARMAQYQRVYDVEGSKNDVDLYGATQKYHLLRPSRERIFGHVQSTLIQAGTAIYLRHTLTICRAHTSDISPVGGNADDGCESLLVQTPATSKKDLDMINYKCSSKNGGKALFTSWKKRLPIRVFRFTSKLNIKGYRYDGLYSVLALSDGDDRILTDIGPNTTFIQFLLRRNETGRHNRDFNTMTLDELWFLINQGEVQEEGSRCRER